jgi:hypothetical protein
MCGFVCVRVGDIMCAIAMCEQVRQRLLALDQTEKQQQQQQQPLQQDQQQQQQSAAAAAAPVRASPRTAHHVSLSCLCVHRMTDVADVAKRLPSALLCQLPRQQSHAPLLMQVCVRARTRARVCVRCQR